VRDANPTAWLPFSIAEAALSGQRGGAGEQLECWAEGVRRAMEFRKRFGDNRFVDVSVADLNADLIGAHENGYDRFGPTFADGLATFDTTA
jgi:hypothetical protein